MSREDLEPHRVVSREDLEPHRVVSREDLEPHRVVSREDLEPQRVVSQEDLESHRIVSREDLGTPMPTFVLYPSGNPRQFCLGRTPNVKPRAQWGNVQILLGEDAKRQTRGTMEQYADPSAD